MTISTITNINSLLLLALVALALYFDLTRKKIPNFLTFPAIIWGLLSYTIAAGFSGLWFSLLGFVVGLAVFFIPFALGWMGAGDVKLLGAVGALQGWQFVLSVALLTAIAGGVLALGYLLVTGRLARVLKKGIGFVLTPILSSLYMWTQIDYFNKASAFFARQEQEIGEPARMPYAVAIATGTFTYMSMVQFSWGTFILEAILW